MLLFLDIDGTLIPFGASEPYPRYAAPDPALSGAHPLLDRVDPALGRRLARLVALGCTPVWATTWEHDEANACLAPWLGLPPLPQVEWPEDTGPVHGGLHWKTRPLLDRAVGRAFVWLDDEIGDADRAWAAAHHPAPALLHRVDHRRGLTGHDLAAVESWLSARTAVASPS
ncbi:HAD domain-containing protein [Streptomyces griseosporeus]|uniref:HAD domain-containing protein n=1 Tax=Streptomyces griseosporeus TaxID=1910 RepID=UPI0036FD0E6B